MTSSRSADPGPAADLAPPRRRDARATRRRILEAAQHAFSETGYSHAGLRDIAARAGTSSTLVLRYFGSKVALFEAALTAAMPVQDTLRWSRDEYPERLAEALLDTANPVRPPLMIALASGDPEAAAAAARVTEARIIGPVAAWLGGADARSRALGIAALATGFATFMRQLPLTPLPPAEQAHQTAWFIGAVRALVEGDGGPPGDAPAG
ncbi:TetR/AcrR family transcriptional regulator [Trujillonella endophytica]|uniref:Transcriptional regulator, TetR family n=1 Tax=Trujillonella endophytica TaxID=673521 RepID=A0A1H8PFY2_9ACTN|nr:TetR/AcrR family transcriptional regulator [Trujillella endophytica]SEO40815.1 transcriptional regulator, TetR family [Trujillella endophytica]